MAGNQDTKAAEGTYASFLTLFKYGAIATAAITALVVFLLA